MEKIFHGIMKASALGTQEKMRVVRMLEHSGKQPHQVQEVEAMLKATLFYWLNNKTSPLDMEYSERIFKAWSQNHIPVMVKVVTNDVESVISDISKACHEQQLTIEADGSTNKTGSCVPCNGVGSVSVYSIIQAYAIAIRIINDQVGKCGDVPAIQSLLDSLLSFVKNNVLYDLFKQGTGIKTLHALTALLMDHPALIPWETCSILLNVIISKLSTCMFAPGEEPTFFIQQSIKTSKLVKYVWSKAASPKMMIMESLKTLFGIVSTTSDINSVSVALSTILQSVPETMIAEICSNLVNDTLVSDKQLQLTLSHMIDWLKWPRHITIHHWIVQIASGLAKTGRLIVLFEVTNEYAEAISTKLWYSNIQLTVLHVLTNLLLFHQRCPQAFHKALPHLLKVFSESGSQDLRKQISELIQTQMYIHPGYPDLYEETLSKITAEFPVVSEKEIQSLASKYSTSATSGNVSRSLILSPSVSDETRGERVGLANLGNTCFLNSVVQALYNIDSVRSCLLSEEMNLNSKLLMQLQTVLAYLHQTLRPVVSPDSYVKASLPGWFVLGEQQDSSEYLRFILDGIHEGLKTHNDTRDFTTMFSGNETMVTKCLNCQSESLSQQRFYDLSLHFPDETNTQKSVELVEMIESCLKPVELRGDNQFHCDKCASLQDADRSISEVNLPSLLVITLCRFSYNPKLGKHTKLRTPVKYPSQLDLGDKIYSLNAVVVHSGVSLNGGHYYTYAHNLTGNQQWYLFNDSRVTACSNPANTASKSSRLSSDTPYILLYTDTAHVSDKDADVTLSASLRHLIVRDNLKYDEERRQQANRTKTQSSGSTNLSWYSYTDDDDHQPPGGGNSDHSLDLSGSRFIF